MKNVGRLIKARETDLYPPVKAWLEKNGYEVHGEVGGCDVAARRGDELVLIELKLAVNLDLILQLLKRQEAAESVYAAVLAPKSLNSRRWRELCRLLKRLEAGLIIVFPDSPVQRLELLFHPVRQERRLTKARAKAILTEMEGRGADRNVGGSSRRKIMTAYRERALLTAGLLGGLGTSSPKELKAAGAAEKSGDIMRDNHYGWFERVARGQYTLTESGRAAVAEYKARLAGSGYCSGN